MLRDSFEVCDVVMGYVGVFLCEAIGETSEETIGY
jgi:hypothetical protein